MSRPDSHSYRDDSQPLTCHMDFALTPNFDRRIVYGHAAITFDRGGVVDLDTRDLTIHKVLDVDNNPIEFELGEPDPLLGTRLTFLVPDDEPFVTIEYVTSSTASGLQWLTPEQTSGKNHPFLYSQGQCIHARSYLPCQDSPGVRFTFRGEIVVPTPLRGLMAATFVTREVESGIASEVWEMHYPIPAYLIAFAVGELFHADLSPRCRIWAEEPVIDAAARELEDLPQIMEVAEELFGPYRWDRYDVLIMPSAFPFGGMENQGLTFLNPSVLAGDKSMLSVVCHELAHSWTGNLVTNATWNDFWLNEGWTTWAQGRIVEAVFGKQIAAMDTWVMEADWIRDHERLVEQGLPMLTHLAWKLNGIDPDDAFTRVPYCRGAQFLMLLEHHVGRERFDQFVRRYIATFAFQTITTGKFIDEVYGQLSGSLEAIDWQAWVYEDGIPANRIVAESGRISEVLLFATNAVIPSASLTEDWHPLQWAIYLERFPRPASPEQIDSLEDRFHLFASGNMDVRASMALLAAESGYAAALPEIRAVLASTGRTKYLRPIYRALGKQPGELRDFALLTFGTLCHTYHPIATRVIEQDLLKS